MQDTHVVARRSEHRLHIGIWRLRVNEESLWHPKEKNRDRGMDQKSVHSPCCVS